MALISENLAADLSPDASADTLAIINIGFWDQQQQQRNINDNNMNNNNHNHHNKNNNNIDFNGL